MDPKDLSSTEKELEDELLDDDEEEFFVDDEFDEEGEIDPVAFEDKLLEEGGF